MFAPLPAPAIARRHDDQPPVEFRKYAGHLPHRGAHRVVGIIRLPQRSVGIGWAFDVYDVATQAMRSNYVEVINGRGKYTSTPFRYVWPAGLDLMPQLAGRRLRERWAGWRQESFASESRQHVSIWEKCIN